jgi:hypothetical protein
VLWQEAGGDRIAVLPAAEARVLGFATRFETRDAHYEAIATHGGLSRERTDAALGRLVEIGLLRPLADFVPAAAAAAPAPAPLLAIRTRARPAALGALLQSLLADERRFDLRRRYVVIDDAVDPVDAAATREEVLGFARRSASDVRLLGAAERATLLGSLGEAGRVLAPLLDPGVLDTASGGRAWNWALLLAAGGTLGLIDDDFRFPLRVPRGAAPELDLITEYALETEFFEGDDGVRALGMLDEDPYAALLRFLGQPAGALLRKFGYSPASARLRVATSLTCLAPPARVAAVCGGVYGELPFDSSVYLSMPNRPTLGSLLRPPFNVARLQADNLWQGRRRPHFMATGVFTPLLLDARELLPPTGTLGKADDALFLALLSVADPQALALAQPASVGHYGAAPRDRRARAEQAAIEDPNVFVAAQVLGMAPALQSRDRGARLAAVAGVLREHATSDDVALARHYRGWRDRLLAGVIQPLHRSLREYAGAAPDAWVDHVRRAIAANEAALRQREIAPETLVRARGALDQAAHGLIAWPAAWEAGGTRLLAQLRPLR